MKTERTKAHHELKDALNQKMATVIGQEKKDLKGLMIALIISLILELTLLIMIAIKWFTN